MSLTSLSCSAWKNLLLETLSILEGKPEDSCDNSAQGQIQALLKIVYKSLKSGADLEWSLIERNVNDLLPVYYIRILSNPDLPTDKIVTNIGLAVILIFVAAVKIEYKEIYSHLLTLDHDKQSMLHSIFDTFINGGGKQRLDQEEFYSQLEESAKNYLNRTGGIYQTPKVLSHQNSFSFSPSGGQHQNGQSTKNLDSPISRIVLRYKQVAETNSKVTLKTRFELDQEQEKSSALMEELQKSKKEICDLKNRLRATKEELIKTVQANEIDHLKNRVHRLEQELKRLKKQDSLDHSKFETKEMDLLKLQDEVRSTKKVAEEKSAKLREIEKLKADQDMEIFNLHSENVKLKGTTEELQQEVSELKTIVEELRQNQLDSSDQLPMNFSSGNNELTSVIIKDLELAKETLEEKVEVMKHEKEELQKIVAEKNHVLEKEQQEVAALSGTIESMKREFDSVLQRKDGEISNLVQCRNELTDAHTEIQQLKCQLTQEKTDHEKVRIASIAKNDEIEIKTNALNQVSAEKSILEEKIAQLESLRHQNESTIDNLKTLMGEKERILESAITSKEELELQTSLLREQVDQSEVIAIKKKELEEEIHLLKDLRQKEKLEKQKLLAEKSEELELKGNEVSNLNQLVESQKNELISIQKAMNEETLKLTQDREELEKCKTEVEELKTHLDQEKKNQIEMSEKFNSIVETKTVQLNQMNFEKCKAEEKAVNLENRQQETDTTNKELRTLVEEREKFIELETRSKSELQQQITKLEKQVDQSAIISDNNRKLEEEIACLRKEKESAEKVIKECTQDLESKDKEVSSLKEMIESEKSKFNEVVQLKDGEISNLTLSSNQLLESRSEIKELQQQLEEGKKIQENLEQNVKCLKEEFDKILDSKSKEHQEVVVEKTSLQKNVTNLEQMLLEKESTIEQLRTKNEKEEKIAIESRKNADELQHQIQELKEKFEQSEVRLLEEIQKVKEKDDELKEAKSDFENTISKIQDNNERATEEAIATAVGSEIEKQKELKEKLEQSEVRLLEEIQKVKEKDDELKEAKSDFENTISKIQDNNERATEKAIATAVGSEIEKQKELKENIEQSEARLLEEMQKVKEKEDDLKVAKSDFENTISKIQGDNKRATNEAVATAVASEIKKQKELASKVEELTCKLNEFQKVCEDIQSQKDSTAKSNLLLMDKLKETENRVELKETYLQNVKSQMAQLSTEKNTMADNNRKLEEELRLRKELDEEKENEVSSKSDAEKKMKETLLKERKVISEKYQAKMRDACNDISDKYKKKIEECNVHFTSEIEKRDTEIEQLKNALLTKSSNYEDELKQARQNEKLINEKYQKAKDLLSREIKKNKASSQLLNKNHISDSHLPKSKSTKPVEEKATATSDTDSSGFKVPLHTPGRTKPGRTQSELVVPRRPPMGAGSLFHVDDEPGETFSSSFLSDLKVGNCNLSSNSGRLSELARRNTLVPAHLRSTYAAETQFFAPSSFTENELRRGTICDVTDRTARLALDSPSSNTRSRSRIQSASSSSVSVTHNKKVEEEEESTPVLRNPPATRKRRSTTPAFSELQDSFAISKKKAKKEPTVATSYSKPGPPTPATKSKKSSFSESVLNSSDVNHSHDRTPLLDTTNSSNLSKSSVKSRIFSTPQSMKKVLTGAFSMNKRQRSYKVKGKTQSDRI